MYEEKLQIVEDSDLAYILAHRKTRCVLAGNKLARILFSKDACRDLGTFSNLDEIFEPDKDNLFSVLDCLRKSKYMKMLDINAVKNNGNLFCCDVEIRFFNEMDDIIYITIKEKTNNNDDLIKRCIELSTKVELDQQYFDVMQEYSKDLFFRIDIKNKTMIHRGDISNFYGLVPIVENYPEAMLKNGLIHHDDLEGYMKFAYDLMNGIPGVYETRVQFNDRTYEHYRLQGRPLYDNDGVAIQMIGKSENIQKLVNLRDTTDKDPLTLVLNSTSFEAEITSILASATKEEKFAYLLVDFDNFKLVNEKLGNIFGDFIIENASKRINSLIRDLDIVGHIGADKFAVILRQVDDKNIIFERLKVIKESLQCEFNNGDHGYKINASVGISFYPENGSNYNNLFEFARKDLLDSRKVK